MLKKKYLFLIMFVCLFTISAASAAEISNETTMVVDYSGLMAEFAGEDILSASLCDDIVGNVDNGTFTDLQNKINEANESSTIVLENDYAYDSGFSTDGISINKNLIIEGNGHVIDALGQSRIFYISSSSVTLNNVTFIHSSSDSGGAIFIEYGSIQINDCNFTNNTVLYMGGAIFAVDSDVLIDNSLFLSNSVSNGSGSAIFFGFDFNHECDVVISNSVFNNNIAPELLNAYYGYASLKSADGLADHQMNFIVYYSDISGNPKVTFKNVSYNEFKNQSFIFYEKDSNYDLNNETIRFEVYDGDNLLINTTNVTYDGLATIDYSNLSVGNYLLNVYYKNLMDSATIEIKRDINFTMSVDDIRLGEDLVINFDISPEIEGYGEVMGTCEIWEPGIYDLPYVYHFNFKDKNITVPFSHVGNFMASLYFKGDDTFYSKYIDQSFNVYPADYNMTGNKTKIIAERYFGKYFGEDKRFSIKLCDINDNPLKNMEIKIKIHGVEYTRTTDDNGQASMAINLATGSYYEALVLFEGDEYYLPSAELSYITIHQTIFAQNYLQKYCRDPPPYIVKFLDRNGNMMTSGQATFNINGVFYKRNIESDGTASLYINLAQGEYIITATNPATGEMISSVINVLPTIKNNHDLVKYYRNDSAYVVQLERQVNLLNEKVTFNINGVFYDRYSDKFGNVKLNINLAPGDYIITAEYNGCRVSNNITVLPVLKADDLEMTYKDGSAFIAYLLDGQGNPYSGQDITFNINGVFYNRTTDDSGIARLNINLMAGEYIITSMYSNGATISNKVTISA